MRITKNSWVMDWTDYNNDGPATTYYRKSDIDHMLWHYSNGTTGVEDVAPHTEWNGFTDCGQLVTDTVPPYRTVR